MTEVNLIEKKELREQMAGRVEVLDKVKELFLMPKLDMLTTQQVADYYDVGYDAIRVCHQRNKVEIEMDGAPLRTPKELKAHVVPTVQSQTKCVFQLAEGITLEVPNRGIRMFSKRAILRIGMLLRDSEIAKEVRTQLLNVFETTTVEQKVEAIETETEIMGQMGIAFAKNDIMAFCEATMKFNSFKDRHITELQQNNKALAAQILEWTDRQSANKAVRTIASWAGKPYGVVWKMVYNELLYKHGMSLAHRGTPPLLRHVKDDEWAQVQQSICAICENLGLSASKVMAEAKMLPDDMTTKG